MIVKFEDFEKKPENYRSFRFLLFYGPNYGKVCDCVNLTKCFENVKQDYETINFFSDEIKKEDLSRIFIESSTPNIFGSKTFLCFHLNSENISKEIHAIKNFGRTVSVGEVYNVMGSNFKFTDLQASFGIAQMKKLPFVILHKKELFRWYKRHLKRFVDFIATDLDHVTPTYPEILVSKRDELALELRQEGIGCRAVYDSLCNQPFHKKWKTQTPVANELGKRGLHLPVQFDLRENDVKKICDIIKNHAA